MAKRLILVRHAKAEYGAIQDAERSLTKTGQRQALQLGLELAQRLDRLDLMIISPAKRAQQTAEPLIGSLLPRSYCQEDVIYSGGPQQWLDLIHLIDESVTSMMIVGHEPTVSALAYGLDGESALARQISFGVSTATAVILEVVGSWKELASGGAIVTDVVSRGASDMRI